MRGASRPSCVFLLEFDFPRYGRRPQRLRVEGVLAQTHTPEESTVVKRNVPLTRHTISKSCRGNNPQTGDFVLLVRQALRGKINRWQPVCFVQHAWKRAAPSMLSSRAPWPKPTPRRNQLFVRRFCLPLTQITISKSRGRNNPQMGDFLNESDWARLRIDHNADKISRQLMQAAQSGRSFSRHCLPKDSIPYCANLTRCH